MDELIFIVEEAPEGGYTARALGASIFTEADDLATLHEQEDPCHSVRAIEGRDIEPVIVQNASMKSSILCYSLA